MSSRLDSLIQNHSENVRSLTVKLPVDRADTLKDVAKTLGISRQKLIQECFLTGLEAFEAKYSDIAGGNGAGVEEPVEV